MTITLFHVESDLFGSVGHHQGFPVSCGGDCPDLIVAVASTSCLMINGNVSTNTWPG